METDFPSCLPFDISGMSATFVSQKKYFIKYLSHVLFTGYITPYYYYITIVSLYYHITIILP